MKYEGQVKLSYRDICSKRGWATFTDHGLKRQSICFPLNQTDSATQGSAENKRNKEKTERPLLCEDALDLYLLGRGKVRGRPF